MERLNEIVTFIIIAVLVYHTYRGYRRGFIKQAAFIVNTIIAFIAAPIIMPIFWELMIHLDVKDQLERYLQTFLNAYQFSHSVSGIKLNPELADATIAAADTITRKILEQNAGIIAGNIVRVTSYMFGFVTIRILLHFVFNVSALISALPIIHEFDKAVGALSGALMTILSIWIIISLLSLFSFLPIVGTVSNLINQLPVIASIRAVNPFELLIKAIEMIK